MRVLAGRYGPYVKHGATNANVPKGADPAALTLDEAVALLAAREGKSGGSKRGRTAAARKPAAKAAAKPKKKPAKKKAAKKAG